MRPVERCPHWRAYTTFHGRPAVLCGLRNAEMPLEKCEACSGRADDPAVARPPRADKRDCRPCREKMLAAAKAAAVVRRGRVLFIVNGGLGDAAALSYALVAARDLGYRVDVWAMRGNATRMNDVWRRLPGVRPVTRAEAEKEAYEAVLCPTRRRALEQRAEGLTFDRLIAPRAWGGRIVEYGMRLVRDLAGLPDLPAPRAPLAELLDDAPRKGVLLGPGVGPRAEAQAKRWNGWRDLVSYLPRPVALVGDASAAEPWTDEAARAEDVESHIGRTESLVDLLPLMARARVYFGVDNGLGHFAAACGVPTVTVFADTDPARFAPGAEGGLAYTAEARVGDVANAVHLLERARRKMRPPRRRTWDGKLSVLVATHNEGEEVLQTLRDVRENAGCETEFIVVDDASTDGSCKGLPPDVVVLRQPRKTGVALSRNLAAAHATGDAFMVLDAHMRVAPGTPAAMAAEADRQGAVVVPGVAALYSDRAHANYISKLEMTGGGGGRLQSKWNGRVPRERFEPTPSFVAPGWVVSRATWERIGPWPLTLSNWGSTEVCKSVQAHLAGVPVVADRDALVWHRFRARFPYKVTTHGVWKNAWALARACFDDAAFRGYFDPIMRPRYWRADFAEVVDGPLAIQEAAAFALRRRRLGADFLREALGETPAYDDPFAADIDRRLAWLDEIGADLLVTDAADTWQTKDETELRAWLHCLKCLRPSRIVEVGARRMAHLYAMAAALEPGGLLVAVDLRAPEAPFRRVVEARLAEEGHRVLFVRGDSRAETTVAAVRAALDGHAADAVYIDGDHHYANVVADADRYGPLVRPGGALAFHDIGQRADEVRRYWREVRAGAHGAGRCSEIVNEARRRPLGVGVRFREGSP